MKFWFAFPLLLVLMLPGQARTLDDVRASGVLTCGIVADRPGFAMREKDYQWSGFDVDICRAIAVAIVGDPGKVNFVGLQENELAVALQSGEVDMLPRGPRLSLSNDTSLGLMFATPTFFDEQPKGGVEVYGPMVRQDDSNWLQVVRWTVWSLLGAEALGIDARSAASANPEGLAFLAVGQSGSALGLGLEKAWPTRVVSAMGNYGEIFERHFGTTSMTARQRGLNRLFNNGGLFYAPPFD